VAAWGDVDAWDEEGPHGANGLGMSAGVGDTGAYADPGLGLRDMWFDAEEEDADEAREAYQGQARELEGEFNEWDGSRGVGRRGGR